MQTLNKRSPILNQNRGPIRNVFRGNDHIPLKSNPGHKQIIRSRYFCNQSDLRDKLNIPDNVFIKGMRRIYFTELILLINAFKDDQKHRPPSRILQSKHLQVRSMNLQPYVCTIKNSFYQLT